MGKRTKTTDAAEILYRRVFEGRPERIEVLKEVRSNHIIARKVYDMRTAMGLSQSGFAKKAGTTAAIIDQLENADYEGNVFSEFNSIVEALKKHVELRVVSRT